MNAKPALPPHYPALDGLRAIAALMVVVAHSNDFIGMDVPALKESLLLRFSLAGDMGVDLFFVLSGFLISSILVDPVSKDASLRTFWIRRGLRILPLYYLYLAVLLAVVAVTPLLADQQLPIGVLGWVGHCAFLSNFVLLLQGQVALEVIILWTLAVEAQFYLLWPLVARRHSRAELLRFAAIMVAFAPLLRLGCALFAPNTDAFYFLPFCRMDALFVGAALALAWQDPTLRARLSVACRWLVVPAVLFLLYRLQETTYHQESKGLLWKTIYYSALAAAWGVVVCRALTPGPIAKLLLEGRVLRYVGRVSYSLYLWHPLTMRAVSRALGDNRLEPTLLLALNLALLLVVASLSFYLFERPILKAKVRWQYA